MVKKLDELKQEPKDPNSPESQAFLKELHMRSLERQARMKKMIADWQEEDKQNELR
jgi:hypothetical protein